MALDTEFNVATVLGMVGGKAAVINGFRCIGHSLCADACPVGAITMAMATSYLNLVATSGATAITHIGLVNGSGVELSGGNYALTAAAMDSSLEHNCRVNP